MTTAAHLAESALLRMKAAKMHSSNCDAMNNYFTESKRIAHNLMAMIKSDVKAVGCWKLKARFDLLLGPDTRFKSRMGLRGWIGIVEQGLTDMTTEK